MTYSHRRIHPDRSLVRSLASVVAGAGLVLSAASASAAVSLLDTRTNPLDTTIKGGGGSFSPPPVLATPYNVRTTTRVLCSGSPVPSGCFYSNGTTWVRIEWSDVSSGDVRTHLERKIEPNGAWTRIKSVEGSLDGAQFITSTGLPPDTRVCHRLTVEGATGETRTSSPTCAVTKIANDLPVTRLQLRVVVAQVSGGGTDGEFTVGLNESPGNQPWGNFTSLDTSRDDFEAGSNELFELNVTEIGSYRDVTRIVLGSSTTDEMCVEQVQLLVNGNENNGTTLGGNVVVYDRYFGRTTSSCRWVGGLSGPMIIDHAELRASPLFMAFTGGTPIFSIGRSELEERLSAMVGTMLYYRSDAQWDPDDSSGVEVSYRTNPNTLKPSLGVHLDIEGRQEGFTVPVDVDFLVTPSFVATSSSTLWILDIQVHDFSANVPWWADLFSGFQAADQIALSMESSFDSASGTYSVVVPKNCIAPTLEIKADASLRFGCSAFKTTTTTTFTPTTGTRLTTTKVLP